LLTIQYRRSTRITACSAARPRSDDLCLALGSRRNYRRLCGRSDGRALIPPDITRLAFRL
jgi:hypothetical protein